MNTTNWKKRADEIINRPISFDTITNMKDALKLINERLDETQRRGWAWGSMEYMCEKCAYREIRYLEVGVEGPDHWREDRTYIPCAFTAGTCPQCGGSMVHTDWNKDEQFSEFIQPNQGEAFFRVPRETIKYPLYVDDEGHMQYSEDVQAFLNRRTKR